MGGGRVKISHIRTKENNGKKFCRMPKNFVHNEVMSIEDFEIACMTFTVTNYLKVCPYCIKRIRFKNENNYI